MKRSLIVTLALVLGLSACTGAFTPASTPTPAPSTPLPPTQVPTPTLEPGDIEGALLGIGLELSGYTCDNGWPRYGPCRDFSGIPMHVILFDDGEVFIYLSLDEDTYQAWDVSVAGVDAIFGAMGLDDVDGGALRTAMLTQVSVNQSYIGMLENYQVTMQIDDTQQYPSLVIQMTRYGWQ
jgi:hypothetical protein